MTSPANQVRQHCRGEGFPSRPFEVGRGKREPVGDQYLRPVAPHSLLDHLDDPVLPVERRAKDAGDVPGAVDGWFDDHGLSHGFLLVPPEGTYSGTASTCDTLTTTEDHRGTVRLYGSCQLDFNLSPQSGEFTSRRTTCAANGALSSEPGSRGLPVDQAGRRRLSTKYRRAAAASPIGRSQFPRAPLTAGSGNQTRVLGPIMLSGGAPARPARGVILSRQASEAVTYSRPLGGPFRNLPSLASPAVVVRLLVDRNHASGEHREVGISSRAFGKSHREIGGLAHVGCC